jgi:hypothetical protein
MAKGVPLRRNKDIPLLAKANTSTVTVHSRIYIHTTRAETSPDESARYPDGKAAIGICQLEFIRSYGTDSE